MKAKIKQTEFVRIISYHVWLKTVQLLTCLLYSSSFRIVNLVCHVGQFLQHTRLEFKGY